MTPKTLFGTGQHVYAPVIGWGRLPDGWSLGDVAAVGTDGKDNVYVFHRGDHPMIVFDRVGNFLRSWGEGVFSRPHGISMGPDDTVFCTDDGDHSVRQCTLDGKVLMTLGFPGKPSAYQSGEPFNRCTHTAHSPQGDIYVTDGYGNARVHKYAPDGRYLMGWGSPGTGPGEFNLPHNIACDEEGRVLVADRENHRIQVFDGNGKFLGQWHNLHRPSGLYLTRGKCPICVVGEIGPYLRANFGWPNVGPRISILSDDGVLLSRISTNPSAGTGLGQFISPHGIAVDSRGDIYVGEVSFTGWPSLFPGKPAPANLRCIQKFAKVPMESPRTPSQHTPGHD
jgi:DNA-binding beta-propeller fold protein YncE